MSFDMSGWLDDDSWRITGVASTAHPEGGSYSVPCPSLRDTGLLRRLTRGFEATQGALTDELQAIMLDYLGVDSIEKIDDVEEALQRKLLGPVYDEMAADGVSSVRFERVYQAALVRFTQNEETVRLLVEFEGKAAALDNRATRRAAAKKAPSKRAASSSSRKAGSKSSAARTSAAKAQASSATRARTAAKASSRAS